MSPNILNVNQCFREIFATSGDILFHDQPVINALVPYYGFDDLNSVYLFRGEHPIARFLLPMALLLPFFITIDILNKTTTLLEKKQLVSFIPSRQIKLRFMLKQPL